MKPKTLIMMGVAIVCGLAASYLTSKLVARNQEKVVVLVAKEKMGQWTVVKNPQDKFRSEEILVNDQPKNAITADKLDEIKNRTLRKPLEEGDRITFDDLLPKYKSSLEVTLTKGKRAVAVKISQDTTSGGFVLPGSHVDVIHVIRDNNRGNDAKVILENILVLAIDQLPVRPEDRAGMIGSTATLELSPDEVLELAQVQNTGALMLSLRPYGDQESSKPKEKEKEAVVIKDPPPPPPKPEEPKEEPKVEKVDEPKPETTTTVVTVFNGANWVQRVYTLNKQGDVISSEVRQAGERVEVKPLTKPEAKPAADPADKDKDKDKDQATN
jgi:pilus assembly protein CpaB